MARVNLTARDIAKLIVLTFILLSVWRFAVHISHLLLLVGLVLLLAMVFSPPVSWAERHHVPRWLAAVLLALVILWLVVMVVLLLVPPLIEQGAVLVQGLPAFWDRALAWLARFAHRYPIVQRFLAPGEVSGAGFSGKLTDLLKSAWGLSKTLVEDVGGTVVVFVMVIFVLGSPRPLLMGLFSIIPASHRTPTAQALRFTAKQVRVWAWSSALIGLIEGVTVWIGLSLLHVPAPLLLASLTFLGEFLPYIGPVASAIPAVLFALSAGPFTALWTLLLYLGIHIIESSLLVPFITSRQMEFHPLSVVFAIVTLGQIYGIAGAVLAVPALALVRAFYLEFYVQPQRLSPEQMREYADAVIESHPPRVSGAGGPLT